jgi:hypothetical protein
MSINFTLVCGHNFAALMLELTNMSKAVILPYEINFRDTKL